MSELPELSDIPEPVMARFKRLPFPMQMRVAADVMDAVNQRYRREYPTAGNSANEPISPSSMRYLADYWQQADAAAVLAGEADSATVALKALAPTPERFKAVFWDSAKAVFEDEAVDAFEQPYMDEDSCTVDGRLPDVLWEYMAERWTSGGVS